MLEVLYHHAKFGGDRISSADGAVKNVEFFSERTTLRSLYAISRPSVVCCLSVCDVGAPYSGG